MKIGILTFQNTVNYGAKFQEYALQKYINDMGKDAEVIDYINYKIEEDEKPLKLTKQRSIKGILKYILLHKYQINKTKKFDEFTKKYIKRSKNEYNKENIKNANELYDKIIVGSDQIWNTNMTDDDYTYYLDFVEENSKKLSYAASFGYSEIPERNKEKVKELLKEFKELNVREEAGKNIIKEISKREANIVVDPTFLLDKEKWKKLAKASENQENNKDYVLAYMVNSKNEIFEFIDDIAEKEDLQIIYVSDFVKKHNKNKVKVIHDASPEEFINLINNAKYVITGSFHAICMSIILEKEIYYMLNDNKVNSRLTNIMKIAGLENRIINSKNYVKNDIIDYSKVEQRMKPLIENSKKILDNML